MVTLKLGILMLIVGVILTLFPVTSTFGAGSETTHAPIATESTSLLQQFNGVDRLTSTGLLSIACVFLYRGMEKTRKEKDVLNEQMLKLLVEMNAKITACMEKFSDAYEHNAKQSQILTEALGRLNMILLSKETGMREKRHPTTGDRSQ